MGGAELVVRVVLAAVFVVAAVGKLIDLRGSRASVAAFGVSEPVAGWAGTALPFAELAVAVALLARPSARWGALGALVLLVAFIAGIARALSRGETPDCNCFGQIQSAPVGPSHIVRNLVFAGGAAFVVAAGPGDGFSSWFGGGGTADALAVAFGCAVVALLAVGVALWRRTQLLSVDLASAQTQVARIPPGLPVGSLAPEFTALDVDGNPFTLDQLRSRGRPVALVFGTPGCGPCSALAPDLIQWREVLADRVAVGLVGIGTYLRYEAAAQGRPVREVTEEGGILARELEDLNKVLGDYRVMATPSAVLVSPSGAIASPMVDGRFAIVALLHRAAESARASSSQRQLVTV